VIDKEMELWVRIEWKRRCLAAGSDTAHVDAVLQIVGEAIAREREARLIGSGSAAATPRAQIRGRRGPGTEDLILRTQV
jgi:hypothetical protein